MSELSSWLEEKQAAFLYHVVAEVEAGNPRAALFSELAVEAEKQAAIWQRLAREAGHLPPAQYAPDMRTRVVALLLRRFGARPLRTVLSAMKVRGMSLYTHSTQGHISQEPGSEMGKRHRGMASGGNLRAAVFGVNDGLISNASLIMGIAGATSGNALILLSGAAGLIAGAFSMAAGEYVSVRSQREMFEYQIGLEKEELDHYPQEEAEELALIYQARGLSRDDAVRLATQLTADPQRALDTLAREELGLNPEDLGSPWGAALFSFSAFAIGASIPLLPFFFAGDMNSMIIAIALTAFALFAVGATLSLFTGRNAWWSGVRMLGIGTAAGAVTYTIGKLLGVTLG
ncbi:MAG TPA: VIT1/CCC1 transporter family protein [Burkholderiales bacterium]|nr:VIT1/CCC1 transporter family protein [Burkholderiales bacterium]